MLIECTIGTHCGVYNEIENKVPGMILYANKCGKNTYKKRENEILTTVYIADFY